jgi:NAD(P)-dependent dehydrogenase (short-subunit alcohol dehydrogenase family)
MSQHTPTERAPMSVVITGATSGLGRECGACLLHASSRLHLIVLCRPSKRTNSAVDGLRTVGGTDRVHPVDCDLSSIRGTDAAALRAVKLVDSGVSPPIRGIVGAAGLLVRRADATTPDGFELIFAVNWLAHHALLLRLIPALAVGGRVVLVTSGVHFGDFSHTFGAMPAPRWASPADLALPKRNSVGSDGVEAGKRAYSTSKLATVYGVHEHARRLSPERTINAFDPGLMPGTELARDFPAIMRFLWHHLLPGLRFVVPYIASARSSGHQLAQLIISPAYAGISGEYFSMAKRVPSAPESYNVERERELWRASQQLVHIALEDTEGTGISSPLSGQ